MEAHVNEPVVNRKKTFSAIWILPIVALLIGAWLIYKSYQEQGVMITLRVNDASGLKIDKTQVYYKGIPVGIIKDMSVTKDLKHIDLEIEMIKQAEEKLVEDTKFWIVRPKVTLNKIAGLDTLITGSYINVYPGKSKKLSKSFIASDDEIDMVAYNKGKIFYLSSKDTVGHKAGEPVIYKKMKVGEVISSTLYENNKVSVKIVIYENYINLIDSTTLFWDVSGIKIETNLPRINLEIGTFESVIAGGIEFTSFENGKKVDSNHVFPLFKSKKNALNSRNILITFDIPIEYGVAIGTQIRFKSVVIGKITDIDLNEDLKIFKAKARIIPKARHILTSNSYFWLVSPKIDINGIKNVDTLIKGEYINVNPKNGNRSNHFFLHKLPPLTFENGEGISLILKSNKLKSISIGSPVLYKRFKVGEVYGMELSKDDKILIYIHILEKYKDRVKSNSKFWNVSGISMEGGIFSKINIKTESIKSLMVGGIAFETPDNPKSQPVKPNTTFKLYDQYNPEWANTANNLTLFLKTDKLGSLKKDSPILYHQFKVGNVDETKLSVNDKSIIVKIKIFEPYKKLINTSTKFWNASGIEIDGGIFDKVNVKTSSVESLVRGGVEFETFDENADKIANNAIFKLYDKKHETWFSKKSKSGLHLILISNTLGSVKKGNPVLYRQFKVGEVLKTKLSEDGTHILISVLIYEPYKKFVNSSSKFYNDSGVKMEGGLFSKVEVNAGSLETIVTGGISFITPDKSNLQTAKQNEKFILHKKLNSDWLKISSDKGLELTLATDTLGSVKKGNPVLYRQFKVGEVTSAELSLTSQNVLIHIKIYERYKQLVNSETKFWNNSGIYVTGGLLSKMSINIGSVETIIKGGISFATPDNKKAKPVKNGATFPLYKHVYKEWLSWDPYINIGLNEKSLKEIKDYKK